VATAPGRVLKVSGQGEELLFMLFPHLGGLRVERVEDAGEAVVIWACCRALHARCPSCGSVSSRVHGGYARVVADGAAGGRPVLIVLAVRRFRCADRSCAKVTFTEQMQGLTVRYRRRSVPLLGMLADFGLELAGRAAARLAGAMGVPVHSSTVLRLVKALPDPPAAAAPEVTGIDDFALRRGAGVRHRGRGRGIWGRDRPAAGPGGRHRGGVADGASRRRGSSAGTGPAPTLTVLPRAPRPRSRLLIAGNAP
jgi:hypothetical protein